MGNPRIGIGSVVSKPGEFARGGHEGRTVPGGGADDAAMPRVQGEALEYGAEVGVGAGVDDCAAFVEEREGLALGRLRRRRIWRGGRRADAGYIPRWRPGRIASRRWGRRRGRVRGRRVRSGMSRGGLLSGVCGIESRAGGSVWRRCRRRGLGCGLGSCLGSPPSWPSHVKGEGIFAWDGQPPGLPLRVDAALFPYFGVD